MATKTKIVAVITMPTISPGRKPTKKKNKHLVNTLKYIYFMRIMLTSSEQVHRPGYFYCSQITLIHMAIQSIAVNSRPSKLKIFVRINQSAELRVHFNTGSVSREIVRIKHRSELSR